MASAIAHHIAQVSAGSRQSPGAAGWHNALPESASSAADISTEAEPAQPRPARRYSRSRALSAAPARADSRLGARQMGQRMLVDDIGHVRIAHRQAAEIGAPIRFPVVFGARERRNWLGWTAKRTVEVAVVGGGPAGLTAAIALAAAGVETALIAQAPPADNRTTALLSGSVAALEALGVWPLCRATPRR